MIYLSYLTRHVTAQQSSEKQLTDMSTQLESVSADLTQSMSDLADSEGKYEILKEKAQKKLHELKKQLDEKNALLSSNEQVCW